MLVGMGQIDGTNEQVHDLGVDGSGAAPAGQGRAKSWWP